MNVLKKLQTSFGVTVTVLLLSFVSLVPAMIIPDTAQAGSIQLQALLDQMNSTCKDMNRGSDTWKNCETLQGKLVASAGCSNKMFRESEGKWSVTPQNAENCQTKLKDSAGLAKRHQDMLDFIKSKCNDVTDVRGGANFFVDAALTATPFGVVNTTGNVAGLDLVNFDGSWNNCEGTQQVLKNIGCGNLFEKTGSSVFRNKWNWKQDAVSNCQNVINTVKSGQPTQPGQGAEAEAEINKVEVDNCKSNIKDLGWIVCPIITNGMKATDYVFTEFIEPMLVNVPISATEGNGTFEAWKQFRILGNIILIGTLLAVVYSQARSDQ